MQFHDQGWSSNQRFLYPGGSLIESAIGNKPLPGSILGIQVGHSLLMQLPWPTLLAILVCSLRASRGQSQEVLAPAVYCGNCWW